MFITKPFLRGASCVLLPLLLLLSSCEKPLPVPKNVIEAAFTSQGDRGSLPMDFIVGEPLVSTGGFGIKGKPIYPVRIVFMSDRKLPIRWDKQTGLPQETESVRAYIELEFTQNEFGEWSSQYRKRDWLDPETKAGPNEPQNPSGYDYALRLNEAAMQTDLKDLDRLLIESQKQDQLNGGFESHETMVRTLWISTVREIQATAKQEEARQLAEEARRQKMIQEETRQRELAYQRQQEQAERQREWDRLLKEVREEQKAASTKPLPPAPDPQVEAMVQAEVQEALNFVNTSLGNRDGHTIEEFMKMKEWVYPAKVHEAVKQALKEAEDQHVAHHEGNPKARQEFQQGRDKDRARRYQQAEKDTEFQKMKAGKPFENGYRAFHYWMPVEYDAWKKRNAPSKDAQTTPKQKGAAASDTPFTNSLGMQFVPVDIGTPSRVLFSIWETRSRDFAAFVKATSFDAGSEWMETEFQEIPVGRGINERLEESNHPVVFMCKEYGEAFCKWLTEKERASGVIGPDDEYRLPTDTEWSYAVGIGEQENDAESPSDKEGKLKGVFPWNGAYPPPEGSGNFADTTSAEFYDWEHLEGYRDGHITTAPVGSFKPNQLGLYDMAGNVFEATSSVYNSEGGVPHHVLRGSCWLHHREESLNSSSRISDARGDRRGVYGFRCVLARSNTAGQSKP